MSRNEVGIWMPVMIGDMLASTTRLNTEQIGALHLLMLDYWRNGPIPDDDQTLASITRMTLSRLRKHKSAILGCGIFSSEGGQLVSHYLDGQQSEAEDNKSARSERAKAAAEKRWAKVKQQDSEQAAVNLASDQHAVSNADAMPTHMPEHANSNAKTMPLQCPSSSPSPIYNSHSHVRDQRDVEAETWKPDIAQVNNHLMATGAIAKPLMPDELAKILPDFQGYYAGQLHPPSWYLSKLSNWMKREASNQHTQTRSTPGKPRAVPATNLAVNSPFADRLRINPDDELVDEAERLQLQQELKQLGVPA